VIDVCDDGDVAEIGPGFHGGLDFVRAWADALAPRGSRGGSQCSGFLNLHRTGETMELVPYLFFSGNCEDALNFYKKVFGGEITGIMRWKEMPADAGGPPVTPETAERVMHSNFKSGSISFMASDASPGKQYGEGPISLSLGTDDPAEAQRIFDSLAQGGNVEMPMQDMFWGAKFGMLTDKYGIDWMMNCQLDGQK
jgi:PhnB protein